MATKDRLRPVRTEKANIPEMKVNVRVPDIKLDAPVTANIDMAAVATAVNSMANTMNGAIAELAKMQVQQAKQIAELVENQQMLLKTIADKAPAVVKTGQSGDFYVELDKEDGETVGMRIVREPVH